MTKFLKLFEGHPTENALGAAARAGATGGRQRLGRRESGLWQGSRFASASFFSDLDRFTSMVEGTRYMVILRTWCSPDPDPICQFF